MLVMRRCKRTTAGVSGLGKPEQNFLVGGMSYNCYACELNATFMTFEVLYLFNLAVQYGRSLQTRPSGRFLSGPWQVVKPTHSRLLKGDTVQP